MALAVAFVVFVLRSLALAHPDQILDASGAFVESGCQSATQIARVEVEDLNMTYSRIYPIEACIDFKEDLPRPCQPALRGSTTPSRTLLSSIQLNIRNHETDDVKVFIKSFMVEQVQFPDGEYCAMFMPCTIASAFNNAKIGQVSARAFGTLIAEKTAFRIKLRAVSEEVQWNQQTDMAYPLDAPKTALRSLRCTAPSCKMVNVEKNLELEGNRTEGVWQVFTIIEGRWPICGETERHYLLSHTIRESDPPQFIKVEPLSSAS